MIAAVLLERQDPVAVLLIGFGVVLVAIAAWGIFRSPRR